MPKFVLLLHEAPDTFKTWSPAEFQAVVERYAAWSQKLADRRLAGEKLQDGTGRQMVKRDGRLLVTDGPYAEANEVIGGYFVIQADSYQQAVEIANDCPHLDYGRIEIREIEDMRP